MIEVVHYTNRIGRRKIAVFGVPTDHNTSLERIKYDERYAAGLEPAFYKLPVVIYNIYLPSVSGEYGSIWEYSRFSCEPYEVTYNRRVHVLPPPSDEFVLLDQLSAIAGIFRDWEEA